MAKSVGSVAKSSSRLCFTFVRVTTPTAPRIPLPTKFAVAEKHTARFLRREDCTYHRGTQNIFSGGASPRFASRLMMAGSIQEPWLNSCESGGIGRRTRLRIWRGNPWGFDSPLSHQSPPYGLGSDFKYARTASASARVI